MKLSILPLFFTTALASHVALHHAHLAELLAARAMDRTTMDPVRLSVLSVLRTAMPTADVPLPTGGVEPEWYQKLPVDVKALLPSLYPAKAEIAATSTAVPSTMAISSTVSVSASASASASASLSSVKATSLTKSLQNVPTPTASVNATIPSTTRILNGTLATATVSPVLPSPSGFFSGGSKNVIRMEVVAALVWLGLGAGFVVFA